MIELKLDMDAYVFGEVYSFLSSNITFFQFTQAFESAIRIANMLVSKVMKSYFRIISI